MSILYKESNKETARELFEKKEFYSIDTTSDYTNLVDFEFAEKMLYGRVDQFFQPIIVNNLLLKPKRVLQLQIPLKRFMLLILLLICLKN